MEEIMILEVKYIDKYLKTKTDMKKIIFIGFLTLFTISANASELFIAKSARTFLFMSILLAFNLPISSE